jgi:hypothetical protein
MRIEDRPNRRLELIGATRRQLNPKALGGQMVEPERFHRPSMRSVRTAFRLRTAVNIVALMLREGALPGRRVGV